MMSFLRNLFGTNNTLSDTISILDASSYADAIKGRKVQLVDVRTSREYHNGHIKNAINIDVMNRGNFQKEVEKLDKNKPVYLYCRSGARSQKAARSLMSMGFTEIYDLKGGYLNWK